MAPTVQHKPSMSRIVSLIYISLASNLSLQPDYNLPRSGKKKAAYCTGSYDNVPFICMVVDAKEHANLLGEFT